MLAQKQCSVELVTPPTQQTNKSSTPAVKRLRLVPKSPAVVRHSVSPDPSTGYIPLSCFKYSFVDVLFSEVENEPVEPVTPSPQQMNNSSTEVGKRLRLVPKSPEVVRHSVSPDPPTGYVLLSCFNVVLLMCCLVKWRTSPLRWTKKTRSMKSGTTLCEKYIKNYQDFRKMYRFPSSTTMFNTYFSACELIPFGSGNSNQWPGSAGIAADYALLGFSLVVEVLPSLQCRSFRFLTISGTQLI
jgi:hypothetical protein